MRNLDVCLTIIGLFTRKFNLSSLLRILKLSKSGICSKSDCLAWSYLLQNSKKWISSSTYPLLYNKQSLCSGGTLGLLYLAVSSLSLRRPKRKRDICLRCIKVRGLYIWAGSFEKSLNLIKVLSLGRVLHTDCQFL